MPEGMIIIEKLKGLIKGTLRVKNATATKSSIMFDKPIQLGSIVSGCMPAINPLNFNNLRETKIQSNMPLIMIKYTLNIDEHDC